MYLTRPANLGEPEPSQVRPGQTLPYREAMEQTERRLFDEYSRACTGVELLQTLQRAAQSPSERVRFWEKVIDWLPKIFEVKQLQEERVRVGRMSRADADANLAWQMRHVFPPGYALTTLDSELARARCALSKARWQFMAWQRTGHVPGERRLLHGRLGEPPSAPPKGIVIPPPPPAPVPAQGAQPISLPPVQLTRVQDTRLAPFASICRIVARTAKGGESYGTGILIGPYHLLTCAHVIFPPEDQLTTEIIVFPGQNGPDSHCRVKSDGWAVSPGYRGTNCNTAGEDYGIIRLSCPMNPGFMPLRAFDPTTLRGATVSLAGYPWGRSEKARHMYFSRGTIRSGVTITSCTGTLKKGDATLLNVPITPTTSLITHDLDTAPSQSGSPMWIVQAGGRFLVALHAGRVGANTRGKAVLLNEAVRRRVAEWMTRTFPPLPLPT